MLLAWSLSRKAKHQNLFCFFRKNQYFIVLWKTSGHYHANLSQLNFRAKWIRNNKLLQSISYGNSAVDVHICWLAQPAWKRGDCAPFVVLGDSHSWVISLGLWAHKEMSFSSYRDLDQHEEHHDIIVIIFWNVFHVFVGLYCCCINSLGIFVECWARLWKMSLAGVDWWNCSLPCSVSVSFVSLSPLLTWL